MIHKEIYDRMALPTGSYSMRACARLCSLAIAFNVLTTYRASAEDWPQWRGPLGQGITTATKLPPGEGTNALKVRWKTATPGDGCSSPIVYQGRIYLTTAYEGEEPHPWDRASAFVIITCAASIVVLTSLRVPAAFRASRRRTVLTIWTVAASGLTVIILAKPKWFWRFSDPWSGTVFTGAEFPFVEMLYLRPIILLFLGGLVLVFVRLAILARREQLDNERMAANPSPPAPLPEGEGRNALIRRMALVTVCCTVAIAIAAGLMGWRPDWFWQPGQPWLAWIAASGLALFAFAVAVGWLAEGHWLRLLLIGVGLTVAGWLFFNTPSDQFATDLDLRNRLAYVTPAIVLLVCHGVMLALARGKNWPRSASSSVAIPVLLVILSVTLFVRSNELHPAAGIVRAVVCLDADNGALVWQTPVYVAPAEKVHAFNSHATPTPATDGDAIYAYFGSGHAALNMDGQVRWLNRDPDYARFSRYGTGSSVTLAGDSLIVYRDSEFMGHGHHRDDDAAQQEGRRPSALIAFDKQTGGERWRVTPEFSHDSYMTPLVWTRDGETEVVIATWKTLAGFAIKDGALRWKHPHPMQQIVPSLAVHGDALFVTGGNDLPSPIVAVRAPKGEKPSETLWSSKKGGGTMVSPVCWDGRLFTMSHLGVLSCRSADTGEAFWSQRLGGRYLGSIVAGAGKLFMVDHEGTLFIVAADEKGGVLAEYTLFETCAATPALANGCVYVRTSRHLYCIAGK